MKFTALTIQPPSYSPNYSEHKCHGDKRPFPERFFFKAQDKSYNPLYLFNIDYKRLNLLKKH